MLIKNVEIVPIRPQQGLIAIAHVVLDDLHLGCIGIHKRLDGSGYRITYPTKKVGECNVAIYHPIDKKISKEIETAITAKAEKMFG